MSQCFRDVRKWLDYRRSLSYGGWVDNDSRRLYKAMTSRDSRFDGVFFVGVTSTGIYCRPICPVKTPKEANCRFFDTPQEAEHDGFRPCLRCRPELAPGSAPVDDAQRIAQLIVQRLEEGDLDEKAGLEEIAAQFELSSRQIRRIVQRELGVPPIQLLLTRRLLLAKQLLTETTLAQTLAAFHQEHQRLYTYASPELPVELVNLRVSARGPAWPFAIQPRPATPETSMPLPATRAVYFPTTGGCVECPVYDYAALPPGAFLTGPAIITQDFSTIVVQPQHQVRLDSYGNIIMTVPPYIS